MARRATPQPLGFLRREAAVAVDADGEAAAAASAALGVVSGVALAVTSAAAPAITGAGAGAGAGAGEKEMGVNAGAGLALAGVVVATAGAWLAWADLPAALVTDAGAADTMGTGVVAVVAAAADCGMTNTEANGDSCPVAGRGGEERTSGCAARSAGATGAAAAAAAAGATGAVVRAGTTAIGPSRSAAGIVVATAGRSVGVGVGCEAVPASPAPMGADAAAR